MQQIRLIMNIKPIGIDFVNLSCVFHDYTRRVKGLLLRLHRDKFLNILRNTQSHQNEQHQWG